MKRIVVFALVLNAALLGVIAHQLVAIAGGGAVATQNGDTNGDGARDRGDAQGAELQVRDRCHSASLDQAGAFFWWRSRK